MDNNEISFTIADNLIHYSDCAVYNEPAYPNEPCDCGAVKARKRWWTYLYHLSRIRYARLRSVLRSRLRTPRRSKGR